MTSRGALIRIIGLLLFTGIAWSEDGKSQEYCWNGDCYISLGQAESAMRAYYGPAGRYLEAFRTFPVDYSFTAFQTQYAVDIKPLEFHAPYAWWSFQPADHCINSYPTPDHWNKCNSVAEAAAKADEYFLSSPNVCSSQTTPDGGSHLDNPRGGAATYESRAWFAALLGRNDSEVTIRQFGSTATHVISYYNEDCAIDHVNTNFGIAVLEYGYCPDGLWDDYDNKSPVSGGIRKKYPYECGHSAIPIIEMRRALSTPSCPRGEGNPCDPLTGNKRISKTDFEHPSLPVSRQYNSLGFVQSITDVARGWTHNYSSRIKSESGAVMAYLPDGSFSMFERSADQTVYISHLLTNALLYLTSGTTAELRYDNGDVWKYAGRSTGHGLELVAMEFAQDVSRNVVIYRDEFGFVTEVVDQSGRSLTFNYQDGALESIDLPDGNRLRYFYEDTGISDSLRLVRVEYQDGTAITYQYGDSRHPWHVTAILDELGNEYASYAYNDSGRVVLSEHAGGAGRVELSYAGLDTIVTTPAGDTRYYDGTTFGGYFQNRYPSWNSISDGNGTRSVAWRPGLVRRKLSQTDGEGNLTQYQYDEYSRTTSRREAAGTAQERETVTLWDVSHNRPAESREPGKTTTFSYNSRAQALIKTVTDTATLDSRTWTYTYFEPPALGPLIGKVRTIDGPRTDVSDITTFEYYTSDHPDGDYLTGDTRAVIDAVGHRSEYLKYDFNGRLLEVRDANDILTELNYHPRGWISSRTTDGQTTVFTHDDAGNLTRVTQPDGSYISYEYDSAYRLIAVADNFNNRVEYTLDAEGNRISENTFDDTAVLRRQLGRVYDTLNRLTGLIDGNGDGTQFAYDNNGNRTTTVDANLNGTGFGYDALDRLVNTIDSILGETQMDYDARDNLVSITDPLGNTTQYTWDGLDNQVRLDSPDTGISDYEYDAAGNRIAATDARGVRVEYSYDALNRLTDISYPDSTLDVSYSYDAGLNGKGRLTGMDDAVGTVDYAYDARGNLSSETRNIGAIQYVTTYAYNSANRLIRITYPSGMTVDYMLDAAGRTVAVDKTVDAVTETLASSIQYEPFGPVAAFTYGNGLAFSATFDQDYELDRLQSGARLDWLYSFDASGNILAITDQVDSLNSQVFGYDSLNRLESAVGHYGNEAFEYDANGNRKRFQGSSTDDSYTYQAQSNRLLTQGDWTFGRDAAGNRSSKLDASGHGQLYEYGDHNRMAQASSRDGSGDTVVGTYEYDGRGQRTTRTAGSRTTHFIFGPSGALLGEYDSETMQIAKEYIYLNGQLLAIHDRRQEVVQPPGAVYIIDNEDSDVSSTGSWALKYSDQTHGGNHREARKKADSTFRWVFNHGSPGSTFKVAARWASRKNYSSQVDYQIMHDTGMAVLDVVTVNQKIGGGQWQELGTFDFWGSVPEWVEINAANGKTSADAIRFEEIPDPVTVNTQATYFVHTDHLGAPRRVSDDLQTLVWSWDSTPFGHSAPNQDPDGNFQEFVLDLRYPGQYFDSETGLHHNYFRTYDAGSGRYVESDPIGLKGGLNTYHYVGMNPLVGADPLGLVVAASWINPPRFNLTDVSVDSWEIISPSWTWAGNFRFVRLYGHATGFINLDVKCNDECRDWEVHEKVFVGANGHIDVGPNLYAIIIGLRAGPLAGVGANAAIGGAQLLAAELHYLNLANDKAGPLISSALTMGPTGICMGLSPEN